MSDLRIAWCSTEAARFACERWHYSRSLPGGKLAHLGVWESGSFLGVAVFSCSATPYTARPFGLQPEEVCELARVALREHETPVSRILSIACKMLHGAMPGLRLVVSFADTGHNHTGAIYRASNWIYVGDSFTHAYRVHGKLVHPRTLYSRHGAGGQSIEWLHRNVDPFAERVMLPAKHKFVKALDPSLHPLLETMRTTFPRTCVSGAIGSTPAYLAGDGGSTPTLTLQSQASA